MSFAPGQIITAQRLNRLQTKTYWAQASATITTIGSGNVAGTAISITVETDGATASVSWSTAVYATGSMGGTVSTNAKYDLASSSTYVLGQYATNGEKGISANFWSTNVATAGTYTFQLAYNVTSNGQLNSYTSMMVDIKEVA